MLSLNATIRQHLGKQAGDSVRVTLYQEAANLLSEEADVLACLEDAHVLAQFRARSGKDRQTILRDVLAQPDEASQEKNSWPPLPRWSTPEGATPFRQGKEVGAS